MRLLSYSSAPVRSVEYQKCSFVFASSTLFPFQFLASTSQIVFPVLNDKNELVGIIDFEQVKSIIFNSFQVKYSTVEQLMLTDVTTIDFDDEIEIMLEKFKTSNSQILPVLKNKTFYGLISSKKHTYWFVTSKAFQFTINKQFSTVEDYVLIEMVN